MKIMKFMRSKLVSPLCRSYNLNKNSTERQFYVIIKKINKSWVNKSQVVSVLNNEVGFCFRFKLPNNMKHKLKQITHTIRTKAYSCFR